MPSVVVYLPARVAKALVAAGHDPAIWTRELTKWGIRTGWDPDGLVKVDMGEDPLGEDPGIPSTGQELRHEPLPARVESGGGTPLTSDTKSPESAPPLTTHDTVEEMRAAAAGRGVPLDRPPGLPFDRQCDNADLHAVGTTCSICGGSF